MPTSTATDVGPRALSARHSVGVRRNVLSALTAFPVR